MFVYLLTNPLDREELKIFISLKKALNHIGGVHTMTAGEDQRGRPHWLVVLDNCDEVYLVTEIVVED